MMPGGGGGGGGFGGGGVGRQENPRVLRSFLKNFLAGDLGTFKDTISLTQHAADSGTDITDATLQEATPPTSTVVHSDARGRPEL